MYCVNWTIRLPALLHRSSPTLTRSAFWFVRCDAADCDLQALSSLQCHPSSILCNGGTCPQLTPVTGPRTVFRVTLESVGDAVHSAFCRIRLQTLTQGKGTRWLVNPTSFPFLKCLPESPEEGW